MSIKLGIALLSVSTSIGLTVDIATGNVWCGFQAGCAIGLLLVGIGLFLWWMDEGAGD